MIKIIVIIIIIKFRVGAYKDKNIDNQVKETCSIKPTEFTYKSYTTYISLFCDVTISTALNLFLGLLL